MLEGFLGVPLHFTIEFFGFLAASGATLLAVSNRELIPGSSLERSTAAAGFLSLAIAQVVHGGAFLRGGDGSTLITALHLLALSLVMLGVVGGLRHNVSTAAVLGFERPLTLGPAAAGLIVGLMAFAASARGGPRSHRRLAVWALLLGASDLVLGLDPVARFNAGVVSVEAYAAHGLKFLAFIALAWWLWTGTRSSIRLRFVASFAVLLVLVVLTLATALTGVISNSVASEELKRMQREGDARVEELSGLAVEMKLDVDQLAGTDFIRRALAARDRNGLRSIAEGFNRGRGEDLFEDVDFVLFLDPRGRLLAYDAQGPYRPVRAGTGAIRTRPARLGQTDILTIAGSRVVAEATGRGSGVVASMETLGGRMVGVVAAVKVTAPGDQRKQAGLMVIGGFVDYLDLQKLIQTEAGGAAALASPDGKIIASTFIDVEVEAGSEALFPPDVRRQLARSGAASRTHVIQSRSFFMSYRHLTTPTNVPVATLVIASGSELVRTTRDDVTRTLFLVAMAIGGIVLLLAWLSGRRITRPIQMLTDTAEAVREGDLSAQTAIRGEDEVGRLGETFNEMTGSLLRMTRDLREAAREEHELRARIEAIIESMADGLIALDSERRVLAFNREAEHLTGVRAVKAIGMLAEDVLDVRDPQGEKVRLPVYDLAEGSVGNVFLFNRAGRKVSVAITSAVLHDEDESAIGGVAVFRDMSREFEVERLKSEFLSNISHELRTPLTPIKGYAEILSRKEVPREKARQFVGGILDSTIRLERIVELLVDFAALEAGRLSPRAKPVNLGAILEELADTWKDRAGDHHLVLDVGTSLPPVLGDERLLRRSLEEVLDNAIKFSPRGGIIRLEARAVAISEEGRPSRKAVEVAIADEGIGIPEDQVGSIFSYFRQLDGSETRTYGGLGLGLSFVQRIVEEHGGDIDVASRVEEGTRFTITIPAH
ncbi:MAG: HAMP domain-containing protein [Actinobacteria bacterium]|nr:HAMP domain-containing protein [Actinomycetota bacterium]